MDNIKIQVNKWLKVIDNSESWNYERVEEFKKDSGLNQIDSLLIVSLINAELAIYSLIEKAFEKEVNTKKLKDIIIKYDLVDLEAELNLLSKISMALYERGLQMDISRKYIAPMYLEYDQIAELLSNKEIKDSVSQIIVQTNLKGADVIIKNDYYIKMILKLMSNYFLDKKSIHKYYAENEGLEYKLKGRPKEKKVKALKKSAKVICCYLDIKGKLLQLKEDKKNSDKRRRLIADLFNNVGIDVTKDNVESYLPK